MIIVVVIVKSEVANMLEQHCCLAKRVTLNMYVQTMHIIMRPSSLGGGRILRRTLSVRPSVPFAEVVL